LKGRQKLAQSVNQLEHKMSNLISDNQDYEDIDQNYQGNKSNPYDGMPMSPAESGL
jgi:hypothetical protein